MKLSKFSDSSNNFAIKSNWKLSNKNKTKFAECQTSSNLSEQCDEASQTGISTDIIQTYVKKKDAGIYLLDYLKVLNDSYSNEKLENTIKSGYVNVDGEQVKDSFILCKSDQHIEVSFHKYDNWVNIL
jgi:hypothetical protein